MVAIIVGVTALVALAGVMISNSFLHSLSLSRAELMSIAETTLDQLRSHAALQTTDTLKLSVGGSLTSDVAYHNVRISSARARQYTVRWKVESGLGGTRDVTVRVMPAQARRNEVPFMDLRTLMLIR